MQLDDRLSVACGLLTSCLHGNAGAVRRQLPQLVPRMTSLMTSALAAPRLAELFVTLSDAAFESWHKHLGLCACCRVNSQIVATIRPHLSTVYVDAVYCYRPSNEVCHSSEPCSND